MEFGAILLTVFGLSLFEIISSIDNAIINAEVLSKMGKKARQWFLLWGMLFAVVIVRGLLPFLILWVVAPNLGFSGVFNAAFSNDPKIAKILEDSSHVLLMGGGTFLIFLFFHWLFLETKHFGFVGERFFYSQGVWFYAVVSLLLAIIVWNAIQIDSFLAFGAVIGSSVFFITHGFKQQAEIAEQKLLSSSSGLSDVSKVMYLEVIDTTFSIDGVLGAFAFTLSMPLILIGNGLGAIVLRQLTVSNIDRIKKYLYLKNGAMYSILFLGSIMVLDGFGAHIPHWLSPVITTLVVGYFYLKSLKTPVAKD
jgi:hypothetical protein